jgi:peroxiredoxin
VTAKNRLAGFLALLLIAGTGYLWLFPSSLHRAPDITLKTIDGEVIDLAALRGQPVLVSFWATTCAVCIMELPQLIALYHELAPKGLQIVAVAMAYDPPNRVVAMRKVRRIPYPVALDIDASVARAFGDIRVTPTTFLIAPDGRVVTHTTGEMDLAKTRQKILTMLGQKRNRELIDGNDSA